MKADISDRGMERIKARRANAKELAKGKPLPLEVLKAQEERIAAKWIRHEANRKRLVRPSVLVRFKLWVARKLVC